MKTILPLALAAPLFAGQAFAGDIIVSKPSFIEAAVFFLTGREPPGKQSTPPPLQALPLSDRAMRLPDQAIDFEQSAADTCTVYEKQTTTPYGLKRYNFALFPGPRSARVSSDNANFNVGNQQAYCWAARQFESGASGNMEIVPGSMRCSSEFAITGYDVVRRLQALAYIRDTFCAGPNQPPVILKPY